MRGRESAWSRKVRDDKRRETNRVHSISERTCRCLGKEGERKARGDAKEEERVTERGRCGPSRNSRSPKNQQASLHKKEKKTPRKEKPSDGPEKRKSRGWEWGAQFLLRPKKVVFTLISPSLTACRSSCSRLPTNAQNLSKREIRSTFSLPSSANVWLFGFTLIVVHTKG